MNVAICPDGSLLTTFFTEPGLYLVQPKPQRPSPQHVHLFDSHTATIGIVEIDTDSFFVVATNFSTQTFYVTPGSSAIYRVIFPKDQSTNVTVEPAVTLPRNIGSPKFLTTLNDRMLLLGDLYKGNILAIDTCQGTSRVAIRDPLFLPIDTIIIPVGVNGLIIQGNILYFTSTRGRTFPDESKAIMRHVRPRGPASTIAKGPPNADDPSPVLYDGFAIDDKEEYAYVAMAGGHSAAKINLCTGNQDIIAGNLNITEIAQPIAVEFERAEHEDTLYVVTGGGYLLSVYGKKRVGGQVVAVKVGSQFAQTEL